jgi:PAS domain S-box-containing protein
VWNRNTRLCTLKTSFLDMIHPDDKAFARTPLESPQKNEFELDYRLVKSNNEIIWVYERIGCKFDKNGALLRIYGTVQDITYRKLNEIRLKESKESYRNLADNVPVGILSCDLDGNIKFVNPSVLDILSSPSEQDMMAINLFNTPHLKYYGISGVFKQCLLENKLVVEEIQCVSKWHKSLTLRLQVTPTTDYTGQVVGAIAILEDFTERNKLEAELKIAKQEAEVSSKAKSQFLANMSHELRTPLNGVMGMTQLMNLTDLTHEQREMIKVMSSSSEKLINIINDILDLSKVDAGKIELNPQCINILNLIESQSNIYKVLASGKGLDFDVNIENDIPMEVIIDKNRLNQIIDNLIGNAIKFTEKGKVTLSVKKAKMVGSKTMLIFSVSDTGIGIEEDDIPKLFNYFTQLDNFLTKRFSGSGLGLAIAKGLVELMEGEICVESELGKGSTFYFTCLVDTPKKEDNSPDSLKCSSDTNKQSEKCNILLVEDDLISQLIIKQICKRKGWELHAVSNGEEALSISDISRFDLILMDIQMPGLSGYDVAKAIRDKEKLIGGHIPIIATTAYAMSLDEQKCLKAGMADYISKPINIEKLYEVIERWEGKGGNN